MNVRLRGLLQAIGWVAATFVGLTAVGLILALLAWIGMPSSIALALLQGLALIAAIPLAVAFGGWLQFVSGVPFSRLNESWNSKRTVGRLLLAALVVPTLILFLGLLLFAFVQTCQLAGRLLDQ